MAPDVRVELFRDVLLQSDMLLKIDQVSWFAHDFLHSAADRAGLLQGEVIMLTCGGRDHRNYGELTLGRIAIGSLRVS